MAVEDEQVEDFEAQVHDALTDALEQFVHRPANGGRRGLGGDGGGHQIQQALNLGLGDQRTLGGASRHGHEHAVGA